MRTRRAAQPRQSLFAQFVLWAGLGLGVLLVVGGGLVGAGYYFLCDWVADSVPERLPGATRDEVRGMLGDPDPHSCPEKWCYTRPGRLAEFQVYFGEDGRVEDFGHNR